MQASFFTPLNSDSGREAFTATPACVGPWDPRLAHGGPPAALLVRCAERHAGATTGRDDLVAFRVAIEFVGPVPVTDVTVSSVVVRAARSAVLVATTLAAGGRDCLTGRVWLISREVDAEAPPLVAGPEPDPGLPDRGGPSFGYSEHMQWRVLHGRLDVPGPSAVWARPRVPLVPDEEPSGLQRATLVADSGNGASSVLDWTRWTFMNVDLDVHLSRPVVGEWVQLDAVTRIGDSGAGLASSTLSDLAGVIGAGLQTLVVRRRTS